jgi:hypothetical protein
MNLIDPWPWMSTCPALSLRSSSPTALDDTVLSDTSQPKLRQPRAR